MSAAGTRGYTVLTYLSLLLSIIDYLRDDSSVLPLFVAVVIELDLTGDTEVDASDWVALADVVFDVVVVFVVVAVVVVVVVLVVLDKRIVKSKHNTNYYSLILCFPVS